MKRWKKIALALLVLLVLSQTPFIYRRYRFGRLHDAIERVNAQRAAPAPGDIHSDYKGVAHVHSSLGGHSTGSFDEIIRAAKVNKLDFVLMTEHPSKYFETANATLRGMHEGVLFVGGSEVNAADRDRLLVLPGLDATVAPPGALANTQALLDRTKQAGRLVFVAYPEQLRSWDLRDFDGIEIYNLYTNAQKANYALLFLDGLWTYWSYPQLLFTDFYERPDDNLRRWDELTRAGRRVVAIAGNDAHQNVGLALKDQTGKSLLGIQLDPYERSFQIVRTHVLLEKGRTLDEAALLSALARGHCYIAFDLFGDSTGFRFDAASDTERKTMGDEIALAGVVRLRATVPVKSRIVFFKDGQLIQEERDASSKELEVRERGVYRVEVYLNQLDGAAGRQPWIISNPIYVR
ncbi:MAG TPA: hypothetical protein VNA19_02690 [Pyrinomonadaceae bacterium]|jgi:hypothetical protein|nr:hypothetical protein [Pyrinomonadaceae bacterium]